MQHHVYRLITTDPLQTVKINTRTSALRPMPPFVYPPFAVCNVSVTCRSVPNLAEPRLQIPKDSHLRAKAGSAGCARLRRQGLIVRARMLYALGFT